MNNHRLSSHFIAVQSVANNSYVNGGKAGILSPFEGSISGEISEDKIKWENSNTCNVSESQ